ncbi:hypothetical protein CIPAW_15G179100 [Carya illinoinensis]|uniref:Protein kinase domain-containing protein n=1 Tax=Carya illinoinensis TaxID=32201 RepID=A0A8T1NGQ6_CARIL|nr:hypothetical protein CIPAW_15G179100 [Carya illinoinensis]
MEILQRLSYNLLLASIFILASSAMDPYSEALLSLKSELIDDYHRLNDWLVPSGGNAAPGEVYACSWSGINCNKNNTIVIGLDLSMKNLNGVMSGKQFNIFTELVDLNLSYNSFSGQLPAEIFNLTSLRSLDISRNNFSGHFPVGISGLRNLVVFDAFSNSFSGSLPEEISQLGYLKVLNLAGSYFKGPIPSAYGSFKSLEFLHLAGNFLTGNLPPELGKLKTVTHMEIGYNTYEGSIPWQLGNMTELQYLDIAGANLFGQIPKQLSNLTKLESLFLFRNQLTGLIPWELSKIIPLKSLDLSDNQISGPIPESFAELKDLRLLSLMYNEMNGTVPEGIAEIPSLETLLIWSNFFSGSLPQSLGRNSKIKNKFTGGIPSDLSQASKLQYFNISNNRELGGVIPAQSWSLPLLQNFSVSSCNVSGNIPPFQSCQSLAVVELNMNGLAGTVPKSVSNCRALERVDLANNNLSGHIPEVLASLPTLAVLDLSHNSFNGPIPVTFGDSSSLLLLNVSFNDITGSIPSEKLFRSMGSSAFVGNPQLCGAPLRPCVAILGSKGTGRLIWVLLLCAGVVIFIAASVFSVVYLQRGFRGQWKIVSFLGLPRFTVNDVLRSISSAESRETVQTQSDSACKAVLPTGIIVLVRKIEWGAKRIRLMSELITRMGNARHKNLIRLLGFCYNKHLAYILYDCLPNGNLAEKIRMKRDWAAKCNIIVGIAKGLCFLHHDCYPAIPHGDLKSNNIVFDENMEPHLAEFGFKYLQQLNEGSFPADSNKETDEFNRAIKDELYMDVYNFGELVLEILTNGKLTNAETSIHSKPTEVVMREIYNENEVDPRTSVQEEIKLVLEVALLCTRSRTCDRPSMEEALKLLYGLRPQDSNITPKAGRL